MGELEVTDVVDCSSAFACDTYIELPVRGNRWRTFWEARETTVWLLSWSLGVEDTHRVSTD